VTLPRIGENMNLKLKVDSKEIPLSEFPEQILMGAIVGAVCSLKGVKQDWEKIEIEITK
jgi:hypothetical protein